MAPRAILALLLVGGVQSEDLQSCYSNIPFTEECKATYACLKTSASLCLSGGMNMGDNSLTCGGTPVVVNGQCAPAAPATPPAATPPATPPAATPPAGGAGAEALKSCYSNIPWTEQCKASFACLKTAASLCLSGGMDMGDNSLTCGGTPVVVNGQCAPVASNKNGTAAATGTPLTQPDPIVCTSCITYDMSRSPECLAACPAFANCTSDGFTTDIDTSCNIKCTNTLHPMGEDVVVNGFCPSAHLELIKAVAEKSAKGMLGLFIFLGICGCCCLIACIAGLVYMLSGKKKRSRKEQDEEEEEEDIE